MISFKSTITSFFKGSHFRVFVFLSFYLIFGLGRYCLSTLISILSCSVHYFQEEFFSFIKELDRHYQKWDFIYLFLLHSFKLFGKNYRLFSFVQYRCYKRMLCVVVMVKKEMTNYRDSFVLIQTKARAHSKWYRTQRKWPANRFLTRPRWKIITDFTITYRPCRLRKIWLPIIYY